MATKSAAFSSKIRNLNEYYNNIVNCSLPVANTGADIASTLKYFSQTLLTILKETNLDDEVEVNDSDKQNEETLPSIRIKKFPNLNYSTLYHSLLNIIEIIPSIQQSQIAVGQALIFTFGCLAPFLSDDLIETLPHTIALTLTTFPKELHKQIIEVLCNTVIHISIMSNSAAESFTLNCIPSLIMIVLEYGEDPTFHVQLFECLLSLKKNLIQDILCAISYGSYKVRYHATNLLFRYWPKLNPNKSDRNKHYQYNPRKPIQCQSEKCIERKNIANKVCIDPNYSMHGANSPPPYYVCNECYRDISKKHQNYCNNLVQPVEEISLYCENRNCKATDKISEVICYSSTCVILNQNKPISLCKECHSSKHCRFQQKSDHVYQTYIYNIWECEPKIRSYLTSSIITLLKEVPIIDSKKSEIVPLETSKRFAGSISLPQGSQLNPGTSLSAPGVNPTGQTGKTDLTNLISVGLIGALNNNGHSNTGALASNLLGMSSEESNFNKRLLSRYGCYLIVSTIKPNDVNVDDIEQFGKIVSMVLEWFHLVCYMPSDASGELISKIRTQFILPWIKSVIDNHFELVVSCLLPVQPDFVKVGGVWETKSNRAIQIREEFSKFCDLIPYEIVTFEVWDYSMPYWIETILNDVPEKYLNEFKTICVKVFDPDSFTFTPELMYRFISERFDGTSSNIQEQALSWLQILCELDVVIPSYLLINIFHTGLNSLQKLEARAMRRREALMSSNIDFDQFNENLLNNAFFAVFDTYEAYRVYRNQLMLQQITGQELAMLLKEEEEDFVINNSELNINCCIMMLDMILKQFDLQKNPKHMGMFNPISKEMMFLMSKQLILPWAKKHKCKQQFGFLSAEAVSSQNLGQNACQFCEEYVLWFSFAKEILTHISPKNEVELNEINFVHLLDTVSSRHEDDNIKPNSLTSTPKKSESKTDPEVGIWVTSYGVYYFKFSHLSPHLQLLHSMLKELYRVPDVDAFYNLLVCLKMLIIHGDCLELANKEQKGFLIYCLEKLLIPSLWRLFSADYCHLNDIAVPLLIYSLGYEAGRNTFWTLIERDFKDTNWKTRLQAVSKSIAIAQHLKVKQIKSNCNIFSSFSFLFGNLIFTTNDIEPIVSQKSITLIETLGDLAIKSILTCFELQFDCVVQDRPLILKILTKFYSCFSNSSKNQPILTWEFFMNRFNSLFIEQQLVNEVMTPVDITGVTPNSSNFQKKINIAKFAMKRSDFVKSINTEIFNVYSHLSSGKSNEKNKSFDQDLKKDIDEENEEKCNEIEAKIEHLEKLEILESGKDNEQVDKKILHLLISLLMKFVVHDDQQVVNEDRFILKQQNIVLKHLYSLIKYNTQENLFQVSPNVLRKTVSVNAFLSGLPMLMDKNFPLGNILLPNVLRLLRYLPLPSIDENVSIRVSQIQCENSVPNYTIGLLTSQARHAWINTLTIILYKYQYNSIIENNNYPLWTKQLIRIVINTLKFQFHKCDVTSFDPIHLDFMFGTHNVKDGSSQNSNSNTANLNNSDGQKNLFYSSNRNVNNDDNASIKSSEKSSRKLNYIDNRKRLFNLKIRSKSNSSSISNQADQKNKLKDAKLKDVKGLSTSQTRLDSIVLQKSIKPKDSNAYETILIDENSEDFKSCPFSFSKFFSNPKSHILGKKSSKTGQNMPMLNMMLNDNANVYRVGSSVLSAHGIQMVKLSQVGRRSAVTKCSLDDENTESDSETMFMSNYDLIMNANELLTGEYGLSYIKCSRCDSRLEYYSEDSLGGLLVICSTFVHRESALSAPLILDMLNATMRIAAKKMYCWQANNNFYIPGNYNSIAKQFIRCLLQQLVNNKIFYQLFQLDFDDAELLEILAVSLNDFNELTSVAALKQVINDINIQKSINFDICLRILNNVSIYIEYLTLESQHSQWLLVIQEFETLFRQLEPLMNKSYDYTSFFVIMSNLLKVPSISTNKTIIEPFSKLLSFILQNSRFKLEHLIEICSLSNRAFAKDRDKQFLPRVIINELVQSISVKVKCTDRNLLLILQLAVLDAGGNIYKSSIIEDESDLYDPYFYVPTNAADCLKQHLNEIISFIADIHSLTRIKQNLKSEKHLQTCPSEDSLGAQLKGGIAQFLALEFTELNKCKDKDSRSIQKYMPWLSNLPTNAQQGAKEFVECIDHIRFLSWILIGSLTHSALTRNKGTVISYPIPINCGNYIGEHIFYILNGFAEHSKTSAIHMSSLFHSFILCQLWTMYCEQIHFTYDTENDSSALNSILEFWTRITPGILQLLSQTKVLADMVILHFLSLIEGLQEFNSIVLAKFFPIWVQVLFMSPLQGDQLKRAKQCLNHQTSSESQINTNANYSILIKCLQRLQYKVAMIEMQSSNAAQLYNS
ncbi:unnamed protein product [Brachionus calyciflorus]|uniref:Uncharacterized protein n=1 Tax=Brachionus calyciflorus TaxID=104777 RepID=A0A813ZK66_9BILA|nr:unnamed protein product [Brachionus calyciflorus]